MAIYSRLNIHTYIYIYIYIYFKPGNGWKYIFWKILSVVWKTVTSIEGQEGVNSP